MQLFKTTLVPNDSISFKVYSVSFFVLRFVLSMFTCIFVLFLFYVAVQVQLKDDREERGDDDR